MKTLMVGGPNDGKRLNIPSSIGYVYRVATYNTYKAEYDRLSGFDKPIDITTHIYKISKFTDETGTIHEVAFHDSIKNPMEALIKGYHYHRNPRRGR